MGRTIRTNSRSSIVSASGHAAIYTRISDDKEDDREGVDRQEQDSRALADRLGLLVAEVFVENSVSASTNSRTPRPKYDDMLARARRGEFSHILAYSNSRLTRRLLETIDLIDLYRQHGVVVKTVVSGEFDLSTADGRATALTLATWDQAEAERVGERVKRAAQQRVESGRWHGGVPPFGYAKTEHKTLVVNEREAKLVREAADRILNQDETLYGIVKSWNERGDLTRGNKTRAPAEWRHSVLRNVLTNKALIGLNSADIEAWPAILDRSTYDRLVDHLAPDSSRRTNPLGVKSSKHSLGGGIVRCQRCGQPLYPVSREGRPVKLVCRAFANGDHENHPKRHDGSSEGRVSIDMNALEAYLFEQVIDRLADSDYWASVKRQRAADNRDADLFRSERDEKRAERGRAQRAFLAGVMSEREAQREVQRLDGEIERLDRKIESAAGAPTAHDLYDGREAQLRGWRKLAPADRRLILRAFIDHVSVGDWPSDLTRRPVNVAKAMDSRVTIEWRED